MKKILTSLMLFICVSSFGQVETFESLFMGSDSVNDGRAGTEVFIFSNFAFPVIWDTTYDYWSAGWAASTSMDSSTRGSDGLYDVANGTVPSGMHYLVGQQASTITVTHDQDKYTRPVSLKIALNTYAYHSIKSGDQFAKQFGGNDGTDPDYFILKIFGMDKNTKALDSIEFALADYRFDDNNKDYIIFDWTSIDLTAFDNMELQSMTFILSSSDEGSFGINTPTFFVIDDIQYESNAVGVKQIAKPKLQVYPNPTTDFIYGQDFHEGWEVLDAAGRSVHSGNDARIDMRNLEPGFYFLRLADGRSTRIVKK